MKRFTFDIGDDGDETLAQVCKATGTSSKSEVIRDALAIYEVLVEKAKDGNSLFVGIDRERAFELVMPALKRAHKLALNRSRAQGSAEV